MVTGCRESSHILMEMGICGRFACHLHWPLAVGLANAVGAPLPTPKAYSTLCIGWENGHMQFWDSSFSSETLNCATACSTQCWLHWVNLPHQFQIGGRTQTFSDLDFPLNPHAILKSTSFFPSNNTWWVESNACAFFISWPPPRI